MKQLECFLQSGDARGVITKSCPPHFAGKTKQKKSAIPASNYRTRESSLHDLKDGATQTHTRIFCMCLCCHLILITGGVGVMDKVEVLNQSSDSVYRENVQEST